MRVFAHGRSSTACRNRRGKCARLRFPRNALAVLIAIMFAAQAFVVQTHIHGITQGALTTLSVGKTAVDQPTKRKLPAQPNERNCPLCDLAMLVGSCVVPLVAIPLPTNLSALQPVAGPVRFTQVQVSSYSWLVRAPPR